MAKELSFLGACRKARINSPCRTHNEEAIHKGFTYILFTVLNKNKDNRKVGDTPEENFFFHALINFESLLSGECKENVQNDIFTVRIQKEHLYLSGEGNKDRNNNLLRHQDGFSNAHEEVLIERNLTSSSWWIQTKLLVNQERRKLNLSDVNLCFSEIAQILLPAVREFLNLPSEMTLTLLLPAAKTGFRSEFGYALMMFPPRD